MMGRESYAVLYIRTFHGFREVDPSFMIGAYFGPEGLRNIETESFGVITCGHRSMGFLLFVVFRWSES